MTVNIVVADAFAGLIVTDAGLNQHVVAGSMAEHEFAVKLKVPVKPATEARVSVIVAEVAGAEIVRTGLGDEIVRSAAFPLLTKPPEFTRLVTSTEPRPDASSYPIPASHPVSTP